MFQSLFRTLVLALSFISFGPKCFASIEKSERALIAVVNLDKMTQRKFTGLYVWEQNNAARQIKKHLEDQYEELVILTNDHATHDEFMANLERISKNPKIRAVDVIFYVHGHSAADHPSSELCFVAPKKECYPSTKLGEELKSYSKIRMLYSDACYGHEQNDDYLRAGFKVVAGSKSTDTNMTIDMKRFLKKWVKGENFGDAIEFANKNVIAHLMDDVFHGDSTKEVAGDSKLTIDSE